MKNRIIPSIRAITIEAAEASSQVNDVGVLPTRPNKFRCGHCAFTTLCPDAAI